MIIKFKYPKFSLLIFIIVIVSLALGHFDTTQVSKVLASFNYLSVFISGLLYTFSFSGPISTASFYIIGENGNLNITLASILGGIGAGLGDLLILKFIQTSFVDEIETLLNEKIINIVRTKTNQTLRKIFNPILGIIIIASPLPDEIGLTFFSGLKSLNNKSLFLICTILNSLGIFFILSLGNA